MAARRRFIVGSAKSFSYASLLAFDLSAGLSQVTLIDGTVRGVDVLSDVRSSDLMVASLAAPVPPRHGRDRPAVRRGRW